jgi:hypothetical protein
MRVVIGQYVTSGSAFSVRLSLGPELTPALRKLKYDPRNEGKIDSKCSFANCSRYGSEEELVGTASP